MTRLGLQMALIVMCVSTIWHAGTIAWQAVLGQGMPPATGIAAGGGPTEAQARKADRVDLDAKPLGAFPQTASRPLFFEGRRYPERETKQSPPVQAFAGETVAAAAKGARLRGVVTVAGTTRALIEMPSKSAEWLAVGDLVDGWRLEGIDQDRAELRSGSQAVSLLLYEAQQ